MDLDALYRKHAEPLLRYLQKLGSDSEVAADAVQDSFLRLAEAPVAPDSPRAWLYRVATNAVRERARTCQRRGRLLKAGRFRLYDRDTVADPSEEFDRAEIRRVVGQGLNRLSNRDRTALLLRHEGFSTSEIAEMTGLAPTSVATTLCRAHNRLARQISETVP